jgi:hypothetical protein
MNNALIKGTVVSGLLLFGTSAFAQDRDREERERNEQRYHQQNRDQNWWRGHLFQRVREDLEHVQAVTFPFSPDEYRLSTTKQELNELQGKLDAGRYDQPELDRTIGGLERVLNNNRLSPRDRDMLSDDLMRMREFREHQ